MANTRRTPEQWQQIFKQHASSGLQIAAFCKQQKLNPSTFYTWRKRLVDTSLYSPPTQAPLAPDDNNTHWVNVVPEKIASSSCWDIELALPNGMVLRMMNN